MSSFKEKVEKNKAAAVIERAAKRQDYINCLVQKCVAAAENMQKAADDGKDQYVETVVLNSESFRLTREDATSLLMSVKAAVSPELHGNIKLDGYIVVNRDGLNYTICFSY